MRIIGGAWRGRRLVAPHGEATRPTADRMRQALFDRIMHAPWAASALADALVLDAFAGTGALGLEALSRGAARAVFIERDTAAVAALRANIAACRAEVRCAVLQASALAPPRGEACGLVFLDPPYGEGLVPRAVASLDAAGWIARGSLIIAETEADEASPEVDALAEFRHGAARITAWRHQAAPVRPGDAVPPSRPGYQR